ncbi:hypothetical protein [Granulicella aggregans]|uniref:hypothetical protein n=1 Tax=Granulicella aggregans TaxID=474949 RepID=UPI0021DFB783|nr:hypothetical protein [Granulicella aggregans]
MSKPRNSARIPEKQPSLPKPNVAAGDALECRVARLFIHMGFFVRKGRQIYTAEYLNHATDLDVLAIKYSELFRPEMRILECKSGGEGPLDRIFWLAGLKQYVNASSATLVRRSTKWDIKDFAKEAGIEILDLPRLEELEKAIGIPSEIWLGVSDSNFFKAHEAEWQKALKVEPANRELYLTLAGEVRFHEPFAGINFLLHYLRSLSRQLREQRFVSESLTKFLISECVAQLSMFLMKICERSNGLSPLERDGFIQKGLTYGHIDAKFAKRIFRAAHRLTSEMVYQHTGIHPALEESAFAMPTSPYILEIQQIVKMLIEAPQLAATFPSITDLLISERFLKQRDGIESLKLHRNSDIKGRVGIVNEFLRILKSIDAIPDSLYQPVRREHVDSASDPAQTGSESKGDHEASQSIGPQEHLELPAATSSQGVKTVNNGETERPNAPLANAQRLFDEVEQEDTEVQRS